MYSVTMDNPSFHDCTLLLKSNDTAIELFVSRYMLSGSSFFMDLFNADVYQSNFKLDLGNSEIEVFLDAIRATYKKPLEKTTFEHLIMVLLVAHQYNLEIAVNQCGKNLIKLHQICLNKACILLNLPEELKKYKIIKEKVLPLAKEVVLANFKTISDTLYDTEKFSKLPLYALLLILESENFVVDSENSVFYMVLVWIQHAENMQRKNEYMEIILPFIRFTQMSQYFLLDVIPHVIETLDFSPHIKNIMRELYDIAIQYKIGDKQRFMRKGIDVKYPMQLKHRPTFKNPNSFCIRCHFTQVSQWDPSSRITSAKVIMHGYEFYYFLRRQTISGNENDNPENSTIGGFLRCTSSILPKRHYLPLSIKITIQTRNGEKAGTPNKVVFEAPDKAIGGTLTDNENWSQIISGQSPMVINNTITIFVNVEFLDSDVDCKLIQTCH